MPAQADDRSSRPVISGIAAELFVADIKASCDFFTQKLGFSIVFTYGEPPFYAQVKRDRGLNLKCVDYQVMDPSLRGRESLLSADMGLETHQEIEQLFREFQIVLPDAPKGAVGCQDLHRQGSRRKPAAVRRSGGVGFGPRNVASRRSAKPWKRSIS